MNVFPFIDSECYAHLPLPPSSLFSASSYSLSFHAYSPSSNPSCAPALIVCVCCMSVIDVTLLCGSCRAAWRARLYHSGCAREWRLSLPKDGGKVPAGVCLVHCPSPLLAAFVSTPLCLVPSRSGTFAYPTRAQVSGVKFSFDPTKEPGACVFGHLQSARLSNPHSLSPRNYFSLGSRPCFTTPACLASQGPESSVGQCLCKASRSTLTGNTDLSPPTSCIPGR